MPHLATEVSKYALPRASVTAVTSSSTPASHWERSPFRWSRRDEFQLPVEVRGSIPSWLRGTLLGTVPAVFERANWHAEHWFDGLALNYAFYLLGDRVIFRQRLLRSAVEADANRERQEVGSFATPTQRPWYRRMIKPVPQITDNANVNVLPWQGAWLAMTESPNQHVIDEQSLASRGVVRYDDKLPKGMAMTAHPHFDFERNVLVNAGVSFGAKNEILVYHQGTDQKARVVEGRLSVQRVPYVHSFGLTSTRAVVIDHPLKIHPISLVFTNRPLNRSFRWDADRGTRFLVLDRKSGKWTSYAGPSLFCFHVVNTFDSGEDLLVDLLAFEDASILSALESAQLAHRFPTQTPRYLRARLRPGRTEVELEPLSDQRFELPVIPYRRESGRPHQTVWGTHFMPLESGELGSTLVRVSPEQSTTQRFFDPDVIYGGPIFVPRPGAERANDGIILAVGSHLRKEQTTLTIFDATTLDPLASGTVDMHLPLGFHANFSFAQP